jgi:hypothetical protein
LSEIKCLLKETNAQIGELKATFKKELLLPHPVRVFRPEQLKESNIISVFESALTRTLGMQTNGLYSDIVVIRVYYYDILKDLIFDGFYLNGERYVLYTASAGQIRTKKVVFIKESLLQKYQGTLMCGLTIDNINSHGGVNVNKYFAYLALSNSATDEWKGFDIRKAIVVDDMETLVAGKVAYLDDKTFKVTKQVMDVPISHTDGCGMILPRVSKKNFMVRLPFCKGLLASFPFDQFIREADAIDPTVNHALVKDIYGNEHDVLAEGIEIIFTKSQFKMWKYFDTWEEYVSKYICNGCTAGICNVEEDHIPRAKLNYQVLQTLHDMTEEETKEIAKKTVEKIANIASSRKSKLEAFWATKDNPYLNDFQRCLMLYPELLSTGYVKETLKQIKNTMVKEGRAGHLFVEGKYLFIIPDLYAFCQWMFLGDKNPKGLLADGEVFCKQYRDYNKLDCLRSPHLGMEHAVRNNVIDDEKKRWFNTSGIYTSCHDLISKILQFDVDGDRALVCAEPLLVEIAERNAQGILPPYYIMGKASAKPITNQACYDGMIQAYKGGKIGIISNDITKIWNREDVDYEAVQVLCAKGNFAIDAAKTLYEPEIPKDVADKVNPLTNCKVPHFFIYAKDKYPSQVEPKNNSVVNRLEDIIPNARIVDKEMSKGKFDYRHLMSNPEVVETQAVVAAYNELYRKYKYAFSSMEDHAPYAYIRNESVIAITQAAGSLSIGVDMLVHYLFKATHTTRHKVFWLCFADVVLENLGHNLAGTMYCSNCGKRIKREADNQKLCSKCASYQKVGDRTLTCCDCGEKFTVTGVANNKRRCDSCYQEHRKKQNREKSKRQYEKKFLPTQFESQSQSNT